jgi:raffinose/stachyose/melibiose transport system substrate-binding protein
MVKKLLVVFIAFALLFSLAACNAPNTGSNTNNNTSNTPAPANTDKSSDKPVTVTMYHTMVQEVKQKGLKVLQDEFTKQYPNVTFKNVVYNQGTDYFQQLQTALASGDQPEIMMGNPGLYTDLINNGFVMDLSNNSVLKNLGLSKGDLSEMTVDGKLYAFPIDFKTWGVFYNVKMFRDLNLKVPTTHSEMLKVCQTLADAGIDPWIDAYGDGVYGDIQVRATVWPRALAAGDVDFFEKVMSGEKTVYDYDYVREGISVWKDRMQWHRNDAISNGQDQSLELFAAGAGAMMFQGTWAVGDLLSYIGDKDFEFDFFVVPIDENPNSQKLNIMVDQCFMINPKSDAADQALKFLEYWITDGALTWSEMTNMPLCSGKSSDKLLPMVKTIASIKASGNIAHYGDFTKPFNTEFTACKSYGLCPQTLNGARRHFSIPHYRI